MSFSIFLGGKCWRGFLSGIRQQPSHEAFFAGVLSLYKWRGVGVTPVFRVVRNAFYERYFDFAWSYPTPTPPIGSVLPCHLVDIFIQNHDIHQVRRQDGAGWRGMGVVWPCKTKVPFIKSILDYSEGQCHAHSHPFVRAQNPYEKGFVWWMLSGFLTKIHVSICPQKIKFEKDMSSIF